MSDENIATNNITTTGAEIKDGEEEEYEEEFEIEIRTQKGSSIKVESTSYSKLDDLLDKAFNTYKRLEKQESGEANEKSQYQ